MITQTLNRLRSGHTLDATETYGVVAEMVAGRVSPAQAGAFLMSLAQRGETPSEILGAARLLREHVTPIEAPDTAMDCCGTGGDHANTLNISSAVAFVLAGCGVPVAKHGNRAASSKSGAADVLEALGININLSPTQCAEALKNYNYCFLMAPHHHHILKPLAAIRKELGFRTLFNLLGPLANPAHTKIQLMGVFDRKLVLPMTEVLQQLGSQSAIVVHGADGLDEVTLTGATYFARLDQGQITEGIITPDDFGLSVISKDEILGEDAQYNARAFMGLLEGQPSAYRDIVLANTAVALMAAGKTHSLKDGVTQAVYSIDQRHAYKVFTDYRDYAKNSQS